MLLTIRREGGETHLQVGDSSAGAMFLLIVHEREYLATLFIFSLGGFEDAEHNCFTRGFD